MNYVLEEVALNNQIVYWRMHKVASWMSMKSSEIHYCSSRIRTVLELYWNLFVFPPPPMHAFHRPSDQGKQDRKYFWRFSAILQNWTAPSSRSTCCEWRRRYITFSDTSSSENEHFPGSTSVQVLFPIGTVLGEEWQVLFFVVFLETLIGMQSTCIQFKRIFFELNFWNFLLIVVQFHHKLVWSMRKSDPGVSIVSVHGPNSDLNSRLTMQVTGYNFQYGLNLGVPLDPSF